MIAIINIFIGIIAVISPFIVYQMIRFDNASENFRKVILNELEKIGILPPDFNLNESRQTDKLYETITKVQTAAKEFMPYVVDKAAFEKSEERYVDFCEHYKHPTMTEALKLEKYEEMFRSKEPEIQQKFNNIVNQFLFFSKLNFTKKLFWFVF